MKIIVRYLLGLENTLLEYRGLTFKGVDIMQQNREIENLILDKFSFLQREIGLSGPIVNSDNPNTTISYIGTEIGFEIELDWREFDIFVLVVKLEKGELPKGYYMSNGKLVRIHIEQLLKKCLCTDEFKNFKQGKEKSNKKTVESLEKLIGRYKNLLERFAKEIVNAGSNLFEESPK